MNKIAVITMVKNEEDVIESFARHACKIADVVLVANHMSTDKTRQILESLQNEGLPIKIYDWLESKMDHGFVLTEFLYRAIDDEHADLVIPLDADEFLIKPDGNADDARKYFQQLDPEKSYQMKWVFYELEEPEKDQDKFILSRPCRRESANNGVRKCCVGAVAAKKNQLKILKGGHITLYENDWNFPQTYIGEDVFNAHFPKRSAGQILSKGMGGWLTSLLKFGKYGWLSIDWKMDADNYIDKDILPEFHLQNSTPTNDFEQYRSECENRYSTGKIDPLKNVYRIAEQIAIENFQTKILERREFVHMYVLYYGDIDETIKSLRSAVVQTYPYKKISVLLLTEENFGMLMKTIQLEKFSEDVDAVSIDFEALKSESCEFVQFILPGDILDPHMVFNSIEAVYSYSYKQHLAVCIEKNFFKQHEFELKKIYPMKDWLCGTIQLASVLKKIFTQQAYLSVGLSGFILRKDLLKNLSWIDFRNVCAVEVFFLTELTRISSSFAFMNEELVEKNSFKWNSKTLFEYERSLAELTVKVRAVNLITDEEYQRQREFFLKLGIQIPE